MWWWSLDFAPTGSLSAFTSCELGSAAEWTGDGDGFLRALRESGWIDGDRLHDWHEYAGKLIERRAADRERKHVQRMSNGSPPDVSRRIPHSTRPEGVIPAGAREDCETEPPRHWPRTEEEARARCGYVDPVVAVKAWMLARTRGWRDDKDVPIRCSYANWIAMSHVYDQERKAKEKAHGKNSSGGGQQSHDRNTNTANAGKAGQYRGVGKVGQV